MTAYFKVKESGLHISANIESPNIEIDLLTILNLFIIRI